MTGQVICWLIHPHLGLYFDDGHRRRNVSGWAIWNERKPDGAVYANFGSKFTFY